MERKTLEDYFSVQLNFVRKTKPPGKDFEALQKNELKLLNFYREVMVRHYLNIESLPQGTAQEQVFTQLKIFQKEIKSGNNMVLAINEAQKEYAKKNGFVLYRK